MKRQSMIRLVVADDHRMFREGVVRLLSDQPDLAVVAQAENGETAMKAVALHRPDVLVLDISMPQLNGFSVVDRLHALPPPQPRVILLTMHDELPYLIEASRPGVHGFVLKDTAFEELITAIRQVHAGNRFVGTSAKALISTRGPLSPREIEILQCAARGLTNRGTSELMGISVKTVESHRAHIMRKLNVPNITTAVHVMDRCLEFTERLSPTG